MTPTKSRAIIAAKCAGLSPHSTDREHHVTSDPRWASSPLRSDLGFRYTQAVAAKSLTSLLSPLRASSGHQIAKAGSEPSGCARAEINNGQPRYLATSSSEPIYAENGIKIDNMKILKLKVLLSEMPVHWKT